MASSPLEIFTILVSHPTKQDSYIKMNTLLKLGLANVW